MSRSASARVNEIIDTDAPNTVAVTGTLAWELAAVAAALQDKRIEKTNTAKRFNLEIKELEKRERELIDERSAAAALSSR